MAGCKALAPTRLVPGKTARVLSNLNLREEPVIGKNIITTNPVRSVLKIQQGPVCVPYQNSTYLW